MDEMLIGIKNKFYVLSKARQEGKNATKTWGLALSVLVESRVTVNNHAVFKQYLWHKLGLTGLFFLENRMNTPTV